MSEYKSVVSYAYSEFDERKIIEKLLGRSLLWNEIVAAREVYKGREVRMYRADIDDPDERRLIKEAQGKYSRDVSPETYPSRSDYEVILTDLVASIEAARKIAGDDVVHQHALGEMLRMELAKISYHAELT